MILSSDHKEFHSRRLSAYRKMYFANAVLFFFLILQEGLTLSTHPGLLFILVLKALWVLGIMLYVYSNTGFPVGINFTGVLFILALGFQLRVLSSESIQFNFSNFTYATGLIILSNFCLTGMNFFYSILSFIYIKVIYFLVLYKYGEFNYSYFSLFAFIFLGIVLGGIIQDFLLSEKKYSEIIEYWKNYSANIVQENLPKEFHLVNSTILYLDISGAYNYYIAQQKIHELKEIFENFYLSFHKNHTTSKISKFENGRGHFWFISLEVPSYSEPKYAESIGDFSINLRKSLISFLEMQKLEFNFRMGIDSGMYIDYTIDPQNQVLRVFQSNKIFQGAREMESLAMNNEILISLRTYELLRKSFNCVKKTFQHESAIPVHSYILQERLRNESGS